MGYRTDIREELRFECSVVPHDLIPHVPLPSVRSKRPLGLFGFADGLVVAGVLPELENLHPVTRAEIAELNTSFNDETLSKLLAMLTTVDAARLSNNRANQIVQAAHIVPAFWR